MDSCFRISPDDAPNAGLLFVNHEKAGRSGHLGHAMVETAPGHLIDWYPNCDTSDPHWKGHSGYGWMEYRRSSDGGQTWSEPQPEAYSKRLFDHAWRRGAMCEKAVVTDTGRIILFYFVYYMEEDYQVWGKCFEPMFSVSDDGGQTWSEPRQLTPHTGRVFDAVVHNGQIFVLMHKDSGVLNGVSPMKSEPMLLFVSDDNGESFRLRSVVPFQDMTWTFYGAMMFTPDNRLLVYTYQQTDEHNLKYIVSADEGLTWDCNRRAYFAKKLRNPQLAYFGGKYIAHGRSGSHGENNGHFVIYTSDDCENWDEGCYVRLRTAGLAAYSNNLIVHTPEGRERLLIQFSHAYRDHCTNVFHCWLDTEDA